MMNFPPVIQPPTRCPNSCHPTTTNQTTGKLTKAPSFAAIPSIGISQIAADFAPTYPSPAPAKAMPKPHAQAFADRLVSTFGGGKRTVTALASGEFIPPIQLTSW